MSRTLGNTPSSDGGVFTGSPVDCAASVAPVTGRTRPAAPVVFFDAFFIACLWLLLSRHPAGPSLLEPAGSADQWSVSR
jgi:hypothetical protein